MMRILRFLRWPLYLIVGLLLILCTLWLLRGPLLSGVVKEQLEDTLAGALGGRWEVESIEGSWITDFELRGLRCVERGPEQSVALGFERAALEFSPWAAFGDTPGNALESLTIEGLAVELEPDRAPPSEEESSFALDDLGSLLALLPQPWPELAIEGRLEVRSAAVDLGSTLALRTEADRTRLQIEAVPDRVGPSLPLTAGQPLALALVRTRSDRLQILAEHLGPVTEVALTAEGAGEELRSLGGTLGLADARFKLAWASGDAALRLEQTSALQLTALREAWPAGAELLAPSAPIATLRIEELSLAVPRNLAPLGPLRLDRLSVDGLSWAEASDTPPPWASWPAPRLALSGASFDGESIALDSLTVTAGQDQLLASKVSARLGGELGLNDARAELRVTVTDLLRYVLPFTDPAAREQLREALQGEAQTLEGTVRVADGSLRVDLDSQGALLALDVRGEALYDEADPAAMRAGSEGLVARGQAQLDVLRQLLVALGTAPPATLTGALNFEARAGGSLLDPDLDADLSGASIVVDGRPLETLELALQRRGERLVLKRARIVGLGVALDAEAQARLQGSGTVSELQSTGQFRADDLAAIARLVPEELPIAGRASGQWQATARDPTDPEAWSGELRLDGDTLVYEGLQLGRLEVRLDRPAGSEAKLNCKLSEGIARASLSARVTDLKAQRLEDLRFELDLPDAAALAPLLPEDLASLAGRLEADARLGRIALADGLPTTAPEGVLLNLAGRDLGFRGEALGELQLQARSTADGLAIESLQLRGGPAEAQLSGTVRADARTVAFEQLSFSVPDLSRLAPFLPPETAPGLAGAIQLQKGEGPLLVPDLTDPLTWEGGLALQLEGIRIQDLPTLDRLDLLLQGQGPTTRIESLEASMAEATLALQGSVALERFPDLRAELEQLRLQARGQQLDLQGPATATWSESGRATISPLELSGTLGQLRAEGSFEQANAAFDAQLSFALPQLGALAELLPMEAPLLGRLEGELRASGRLPQEAGAQAPASLPQIALKLRGRELLAGPGAGAALPPEAAALKELLARLGGELELELRQDAQGLAFAPSRITLSGERLGSSLFTLQGKLPFAVHASGLEPAPTPADFQAELELAQELLAAGLAAEPSLAALQPKLGALHSSLQMIDQAITATVRVKDLSASLQGEPIALRGEQEFRLDSSSASTSLRFRVADQPPAGAGPAPISLVGELQLGQGLRYAQGLPSLPTPEEVQAASLGGELHLSLPSLGDFVRLVPALRQASGQVNAKLALAGRVEEPAASGTISVSDLSVRTAAELPTLADGEIAIRLTGRRADLEMTGTLGYEPIGLKGSVTLREQPDLDLHLTGERALVVRTPDLRVRTNLDITVKGLLDQLAIAGTVEVADALFAKSFTSGSGAGASSAASAPVPDSDLQLFSVEAEPFDKATLDLLITADDSIRIETDLARGAVGIDDLRLKGTLAVPRPEGAIRFDGMRVDLPFSRLTLERGALRFSSDQPFRPLLEVEGRTRLRGYELDVLVRDRFPDISPRFRSRPPLSRQDAFLLITTGATSAGLKGEGLGGAALSRAGSLLGNSLLGGEGDGKSLAERTDLQFGREISETGAYTIEVEYEYDEPWFLRLERDRYDAYNVGVVWRVRFR